MAGLFTHYFSPVHGIGRTNVLDMHVCLIHKWGMTLAEYMKSEGMTDAKLAELVKRDRSNVTRWRLKRTKPDFEALVAIERITRGKVTAKDFATAEAAA